MAYIAENAVILAAGTASRFAPLSLESPKALLEVRGEILIERQIRQLQAAGIKQIILVTGYMKERFLYLQEKLGVILVENPFYLSRNNCSSIYAAKDYIRNTYICSSDNYFAENPFELEVEDAYYAAVYAKGETPEWCMTEDPEGYIRSVQIGGRNAWYMLGHAFWSAPFSRTFLSLLEQVYAQPDTKNKLWEHILAEHLDKLKMKLRKYPTDVIFEFDTLEELRRFDPSYIEDTRSSILKSIACRLGCTEGDIADIAVLKDHSSAFRFCVKESAFVYDCTAKQLTEVE